MPTKQEVLDNIQNVAHSAAQVKHLINGITVETKAPTRLKRGDCFLQHCGQKKRPLVVIKVLKEIRVLLSEHSR